MILIQVNQTHIITQAYSSLSIIPNLCCRRLLFGFLTKYCRYFMSTQISIHALSKSYFSILSP